MRTNPKKKYESMVRYPVYIKEIIEEEKISSLKVVKRVSQARRSSCVGDPGRISKNLLDVSEEECESPTKRSKSNGRDRMEVKPSPF